MKDQTSKQERHSILSAVCELFIKAKTETIHTITEIGRKHTILRYPIMAALFIIVFIYNVILYGCIRQKVSERFAMSLALVMATALIFTCVDNAIFAEIAVAVDNRKLQNGSFEEGQSWSSNFSQLNQSDVPAWNTTAFEGKIELFKSNSSTYISNVTLTPSDGLIAAELNADEESTLYQNVTTEPSSVYKWGLDHGARNGTDTMALVIGPKQDTDPSKPSKTGRDQLMQMVDWLIEQGKTSVKTSGGLGEQLVVYSKKFAANGTFQDNTENNAFSLTPSSIYTEEWHIWIIADSRATSGTNPWGHYGSNAEGSDENTNSSGSNSVDLSKYYYYIVPKDQTETLFGFVSVGCVDSPVEAYKAKTYGNFLDNINFEIYHPLSGSTTLHGSGVVGGSDGTTSGEGTLSAGYEITVDNHLLIYAVDGEPLKVQAVVKKSDADAGCEFVGLYYTKQDANGNLVTVFLQIAENEIEDTGSLSDEEKQGKWISSTNGAGDTVHTYYLDNITSATDLHFVFIKSPTVTYDPNGGKAYIVERTYNNDEAANVYSYKPVVNEGEYTFITPYVSHAAEGQNDGWKFMGWLLTGDTADNIPEGTQQINKDKLGTFLLDAKHTIACDYNGEETKEQYFKVWNDVIPLTENVDNILSVKWETNTAADYANIHKGLTMIAQWRWRQAFIPQIKGVSGYFDSDSGGTVNIIGVTNTDTNYNGAYNAAGGKAYFAETNEIVTVEAAAKEGYEFEGWYDKNGQLLTSKKTYSFTATKESVNTYYARFTGEVTQNFVRQVYNNGSWVDTEDNDIATLDCYTYSGVAGNSISSAATAETGYVFVGWFDADGNEVAESMLDNEGKTISYTITGNATYYARFARESDFVIQTFVRQIYDEGTWVDIENNDIATLDLYSHSDVVGETVSSTAAAGEGYEFVGWYDADGKKVAESMLNNEGKTISYSTTGIATYYARFSKKVTQTFVRQVKNSEGTWVETTNDSIATLTAYTHTGFVGETASSTASAGYGYTFEGWYDADGNKVANIDMLSYTTTKDVTYYARFSRITVTQTFVRQVKDGENWENTSDDSIAILTAYTYTDFVGETASSTALAGTGYKFEGWYNANGEKVTDTDMLSSDGMTLSYTTTEDATYYARFERYVPPEETTTVSEEITTVPEEITTVPEETTTTVPDCTVTSVPEETTTGDIGESTIFSSEAVTTTSNSTVTSHVTSICTTVTTTDPLEYYSDFYTITTKQTTDSGEDVAAGAGVNADEDEVSGSADAKVLIPTVLFLSAAFIGLALFSRKLRHK